MAYWTNRVQQEREAQNALGEQAFQEQLRDLYDVQLAQLKRELDAYIQNYADANGLTASAAHKRAEEFDIKAFESRAKQYVADVDFSAEANKELRDYNFSMSVTRQELLLEEMQLELLALGERERTLTDSYLRTGYQDELARGSLLGQTVPTGDTLARLMKTAVSANFQGAKWSDRIWQRQDQLRQTVREEVTRALIRGDNGIKIARKLRNLFDVSMANAKRLAVTEHARVQTMAQKQIMKDNGYTHFKLMPESRACDNCKRIGRETDDKPVPVDDMEVGKNAAPIHPNCRCAVAEVWVESDVDDGDATVYDNMSGNEIDDFFKQQKSYQKWYNGLEDWQRNAIYSYTTENYHNFNNIKRFGLDKALEIREKTWMEDGGSKADLPFALEIVRDTASEIPALEKAISSFVPEKSFKIYRGTGSISAQGEDLGYLEYEVGQTVQLDKSFTSFSLDKRLAKEFASDGDGAGVLFEVTVRKGQRSGAYIAELSDLNEEREYLMRPGVKYDIVSKEEDQNGTLVYKMEVNDRGI